MISSYAAKDKAWHFRFPPNITLLSFGSNMMSQQIRYVSFGCRQKNVN